MLPALIRTITELLDSKKATYSFVATIVMAVLIVYFKVDRETALFIVSPLVAGTVAQAHVDAAAAKKGTPTSSIALNAIAEPVRVDAPPAG